VSGQGGGRRRSGGYGDWRQCGTGAKGRCILLDY